MEKKKKFYYKVVYDELKTEIVNGKIKTGEFLPSEKVIGERFGVDRTTVRKALGMLVDEELVVKRAGVGTEVTYRNTTSGTQDVNLAPAKMVGFFMPKTGNIEERITQPFYSELFFNLEKYLKKQDYSMIYTAIRDADDAKAFVEKNRLSGVVLLSAINDEVLKLMEQSDFPCVLVNKHDDRLTSVLGNNSEGGYQAMKHILENDHKKIAVVTGPSGYITTKERLFGCTRALMEFGMSLDDLIIKEADWEYDGAVAAVKKIFSEEGEKPTAIFAFNDVMALGAIRTLREAGIRVPEEVSVVGFDNLSYLSYTEPNLTTIDTQVELMAQVVGYNLLGLINRQVPAGIQHNVPTKLVRRGTVTERPQTVLTKSIASG